MMARNTKVENYRIIEKIEESNYAIIYKSTDLKSNPVVLKVARENRWNEIVTREFKILSQFRHPNIVQVFDYSKKDDGRTFFVLEYINGQPINTYFKSYSKKLLSALIQVTDGLGMIHERGFVHVDIKPEHILYDAEQGRAVLIDFGFAGNMSEKIEQAGTLGYIAPEVFKGIDIDSRADLYSLGVIIYEIVTGEKPKDSPDLIKGVPREFKNVVINLLSQEPARRPSVHDLQVVLSKEISSQKSKYPMRKIPLPKSGFVKISEIFKILSLTRGKAMVLFGDTGYGKTRLLKELKFKFLTEGHDVLYYIPKQGTNFLDELCRFIDYAALDFSKYKDKLQIFDEILARLLMLAKKQTLVIMVDDCEILSSYELDLFRYIGYGIENSDIVLIGALKPDERILNLDFDNLTMRAFNVDETRTLLEKTFFRITSLPQFAQWLHEYSGGNPLFIVEILRALFDSSILYYQEGSWHIEEKSFKKVTIPAKIGELQKNRLEKLNASEITILKFISLCDAPLDAKICSSIVGSDMHISIEYLKAYGLLREEIINNRIVYTIANKVTKKIVESFISVRERKQLQNSLLHAINVIYHQEATYTPVVAELYFSLDKKKQASQYYVEAAQNAEKVYDYESSLHYYEMYTQCIQHTKPEKYPEILLKIANLHQIMGHNKLAIDYYRKLKTFRKLHLDRECYLGLGYTYSTMGEHNEAIRNYKKAISSMKDKKKQEYIQTINYTGYSMLYLNKFKEAKALFNQSSSISKNIHNVEMEAECQYYQTVLEWFRNNYDKGIKKAKSSLIFTKKHKLFKQYAYTANLLNSFYRYRNDLMQAQKYLDEAIVGFKKIKHINSLCSALNDQALIHREQGSYAKSEQLFNETLVYAQQTNNQIVQYNVFTNLANVCECHGRFGEALDFYAKASHVYPDKVEPVYGISMTLYTKGDTGKAKSILEKMEKSENILLDVGLAMIESALGKFEYAEKLIRKALKKLETENHDTETKAEAFFRTAQLYYEKGDYSKSLEYALKLKSLTNPLSRQHTIAQALIKVMKYRIRKITVMDISEETKKIKNMGCMYDWAWLKRLNIESIVDRGIESNQIEPVIQKLSEIETIFKSMDAALEINRMKKIQNKLFPIIAREYSSRAISTQYLDTFSRLAALISQKLGSEDFVHRLLDVIIQTTHAERGALFLKTTKGMKFVAGMNIDKTTIKDATEISKTAVKALKKDRVIFSTDAVHDSKFNTKKSVMLQHIHALMCIPLVIMGNIIGAIYVDSRVARGIFGPQDKDFLMTVSQILASIIEKSIVFKQMTDENILLKSKILQEIGRGYLIGKSKSMKDVYQQINDIAPTPSPVLVTGETGTGKGMIARLIHLKSKRKEHKFLSINCGTVTETLFESELFGHKRGAFTGAIRDKKGLLEEAEAGTVFLDEITNTSISFQAKLLEAIEEKLIRRVGETNTRKIDVRFLFATNKDLEFEVEEGRFRKDLFYRINVFRIKVPPLREREEDIPLLAQFFKEQYCKEINKHIKGFTPDALVLLQKRVWPGNVRELQNIIERAVIRTKENIITAKHIGIEMKREIPVSLQQIKKEAIIEALEASNWNVKQAAKLLNINRKTIHRFINQYNIHIK
jgi:two-component system response regulator HydG